MLANSNTNFKHVARVHFYIGSMFNVIMTRLTQWCKEHCGSEYEYWTYGIQLVMDEESPLYHMYVISFYFKNSSDAIMFKLRFG